MPAAVRDTLAAELDALILHAARVERPASVNGKGAPFVTHDDAPRNQPGRVSARS
jgi:hypothetical protein